MSRASRLASLRPTRLLVLGIVAAVVVAAFVAQPPDQSSDTAAAGGSQATVAPATGRTGEALVKPGAFSNSSAPKGVETIGSAGDDAASPAPGVSEASGGTVGEGIAARDADAVASSPSSGSDVGIEPRVIHTASVEIAIPRKGFDARYAQLRAVAGSLGGYVVDSSMTHISGDRSATITMRVPGARFDTALDRLSRLGSVRSESVSSQDVSQDYVDTKSRLAHDKAVAASLERLLAKATTVGEVLSVRDRLDAAQQQVEVEQGRLNYLSRMTEMSTIELSITQKGKHAAPVKHHAHQGWGIGTAVSDAAHRFVANVNRGIVATGGALPALLALAIALLAGRGLLRRRAARRAPGA